MRRTLFIIIAFLFTLNAVGQDWKVHNELFASLKSSRQDTGRINTLLKLAEFEILKPGEYKPDLDSAVTFINKARQLNSAIRSEEANGYITIEESYLAKEHNDRIKGKLLMEKAMRILSNTKNKYLLATTYLGLAEYYDYLKPDELTQRVKYVQTAADIYGSEGYIEREASCYKELANLINDDSIALAKLNKSLALYKSIHYKKLQGVYDLFDQAYFLKADYKRGLNYGFLALETAGEQGDTTMQLSEIENHIAIIYDHMNDEQNAIVFYKKSLAIAESYHDSTSCRYIALNLCNSYIQLRQLQQAKQVVHNIELKYPVPENSTEQYAYYLGECIEIFSAIKLYNQANSCCDKLIQVCKKNQLDDMELSNSYVILIDYFFKTARYTEMREYLLKNELVISKIGHPVNVENSNKYWFSLDTALHQYKTAIPHLLKYQLIKDSIFSEVNNKQVKELQIRFETEKKQQQITVLNQQAKIESTQLSDAKTTRNITIGGILLVIILSAQLYRQNRLKKRNNDLLQQLLNEKEWLLKEVHHRVKNNLHTVICLLESQAAYLENDALKAIENSQHRIYAMSLIHQKLYQSDDIKVIDMKVYLIEFITYLNDSFGAPANIKINTNIVSINLGVSQAIPVGLILNEALNNAFKYAFPDNRVGEIYIEFAEKTDVVMLVISDNGIGFIPNARQETSSLGLELIKGLTTDIKGNVTFESKVGTKISLTFVIDNIHAKPIAV